MANWGDVAEIFELTPLSYVVILGAAITNLAMGTLDPTISLYLLELGVGYSEVGRIVSARFLTVAVASLPFALFASRIGLTRMLFVTGFTSIVAASIIVFVPGADGVFYFYLIAGVAQAIISGPGAAILAENTGNHRVAAFALFSTTWMIPPAIGAGISSLWFREVEKGSAEIYRSIFPLVAGILILGGIIYLGLLILTLSKGVTLDPETESRQPILTQFRILFAPAVVVPFLLLTMVQFLSGAGAGSTLPFLPPYLESLNASPGLISLLVMALNLLMGMATQLTAPLAKRFGDIRVYAITTILSVVSLLGIVFSDELLPASIFFILRGTFANMSAPIGQSKIISYIENRVRATGSAWTSTARWVGWTIFSPISGNIIERYGYNVSFVFTAIIYVVSMLIFIYVVSTKPTIEMLKKKDPTLFGAISIDLYPSVGK
ncbi:MAG: MFS transporter [Methanobacteriota archaeon]|nr:MAG: MFS transporter [Euryarchaeota archaeon]